MVDNAPSTMADVAARAGVSVATVSRALRGSPLISAETAARVAKAAAELDFVISRTASSLATGKLNRIAVLVSGTLGAWFNGTLLDAIYDRLHQAGQELLIYRILDEADRDEFFATLPARRNADALILASFALTDDQRRRLRELSMPLVYVNQRVRGAPSVSIDDEAGAFAATRHLLDLGHRRLAFVGTRHRGISAAFTQRLAGFRRAAAEAGIAPGVQDTVTVHDFADGDRAVRALLDLPSTPSGIVIESDELAMSVLAALRHAGVRVPDELSVVGFDDHAMAVNLGLTTIAQPLATLGLQAAELALGLAAGKAPRRKVITVPTTLVERETTSPH